MKQMLKFARNLIAFPLLLSCIPYTYLLAEMWLDADDKTIGIVYATSVVGVMTIACMIGGWFESVNKNADEEAKV